ncbi:Os1348 family NHLP clan protein [Streptomyces sp. TRM72054]|uniref:Os1348 family NHLP clan protein n=1 Tax=Streptomyces sp. TRM72054 TaxID=2870562 RepID=UPI001C8B9D5E|nr:Os1348 family NHLP clan protein [Streptomyces sp. TRM72054]MBX9399605.1 Os1348 family NHLP clan protein [Streptomyces sp. TRM72054]
MSSFHILVGRALTDPEFCNRLIAEPEATLAASGVDPTPELVETLRGLDAEAVRRLAEFFDPEQAAG